jgi:putative copper export protein
MAPLTLGLLLLFQQGEEPFSFAQPFHELFGFLAWFALFGALGFHFFVLRRARGLDPAAGRTADARAARIGLAGAIVALVSLAFNVARNRDHLPFLEALQRGGGRLWTPLACLVLLALAFACWRWPGAWVVAGLAGLAFALRNLASGRWTAMVNPFHELAASLWIGSLFVLVAAGLPAVLRNVQPAERRAPLVAELVARFSNLALAAAALLGVTGVVTAWRHLKFVAALWTTSYGYAFDAKMVVVFLVVALGAWNWRRMRPRLETPGAVDALRRSAGAELALAGIVLMITAVLVSLPTPQLPHP